jgi:hypothetical protein
MTAHRLFFITEQKELSFLSLHRSPGIIFEHDSGKNTQVVNFYTLQELFLIEVLG